MATTYETLLGYITVSFLSSAGYDMNHVDHDDNFKVTSPGHPSNRAPADNVIVVAGTIDLHNPIYVCEVLAQTPCIIHPQGENILVIDTLSQTEYECLPCNWPVVAAAIFVAAANPTDRKAQLFLKSFDFSIDNRNK